MTVTDMSLINPLLRALTAHVKLPNDEPNQLQAVIDCYQYYGVQFQHDLFEKKITDEDIEDDIEDILKAVNLKPAQKMRFLEAALTIKQFLDELHALSPDNKQIKSALDMINTRQTAFKRRTWGLTAASILGFSIPAVVLANIFPVLNALYAILSWIPAFGLIYTVGVAGFSFYQFQRDKKTSFAERFYENSLFMFSKALQVVAYSLLVAGMLSASYAVGALFVAAEFMILCKEMIAFQRAYAANQLLQKKHMIPHVLARSQNELDTERNKVLIDIAVAVALVTIVGVMCFFTGGLIVPVACMAAIAVVFVLRQTGTAYNKYRMKQQLDENFAAIESEWGAAESKMVKPDADETLDHTEVSSLSSLGSQESLESVIPAAASVVVEGEIIARDEDSDRMSSDSDSYEKVEFESIPTEAQQAVRRRHHQRWSLLAQHHPSDATGTEESLTFEDDSDASSSDSASFKK